MQRADKLELIKKINRCIIRNKDKFHMIKSELESIGFSDTEINSIKDTSDLINLSDTQLLIVAHRCDKLFNSTLFKLYDSLHRTWSEVQNYGFDYTPEVCYLHLHNCKEFYTNSYLGYASINEIFSAFCTSEPVLKSTVPFNAINDIAACTLIRDKEISPLFIYTDNIVKQSSEDINIVSGIVPFDSLYCLFVFKNVFYNNNTDIPVYILSNKQNTHPTISYANYYTRICELIKNDINEFAGSDLLSYFDNNVLNSVTKLIVGNRELSYNDKIERVTNKLIDIKKNGADRGHTIRSSIYGSLKNE